MKRILVVLLFSCVVGLYFSWTAKGETKKTTVDVFISATCHVCHQIRTELIEPLQKKYSEHFIFVFHDISQINEYKLFLGVKENFKLTDATVPLIILEDKLLLGKAQITENLENLLRIHIGQHRNITRKLYEVDIVSHFYSFTPLAVVSAGLVDGINPCAFTVIVFFVSFLALQGYNKRQLLWIGISFIMAVFITYVLIGLGIFGFLYATKGFWLMRKIATIGIGIFSIVLGFLAIFDAISFIQTKKPDNMVLKLPYAIKNRIQAIITTGHRKNQDKKKSLLGLFFTATSTGFVVSILEAVCTGQVYLPTISFVLKVTALKFQAFGYLILYNLMFIIPLVIVLLLALLGATASQFSQFIHKHMVKVKILMAAIFFCLGVFLIWRG
ncbi:MAG: hypothetical protein N2606_06735 [Candidatus Omnitrophica bacterium]|nr:hypothetical protein [Candidatus Omnitrophota bacterium]